MPIGQRTKSQRSERPDTARRILEHARRLFNERGVAAVGIREIARDLGLSPGNVSYHFPTKEALITALIEAAHADNNALVAGAVERFDFAAVDAIIRGVMRRDLEHPWLMRDAVGLLLGLPALRPLHTRMQRAREARVDKLVQRLCSAGLLDAKRVEPALPRLRQQVLTQVFFWLSAATLADPDGDPADSLDAHARAAIALFLPYCSAKGRRELEALLD